MVADPRAAAPGACEAKTRTTVAEVVCASAAAGLAWQRANGSFPPGHNGPWGNEDTPVRTTAHWLLLLLRGHALGGAPAFREAALRACGYLLSDDARPAGFSFHCCVSGDPFTAGNGLIGQAWALEALLEAGDALDDRCLRVALDVAVKHSFDEERELWRTLGVGGEVGGAHHTLNQQLWFSAVVYRLARLVGHRELLSRARAFFDGLPSIIHWRGRYMDMLVDYRHLLGGRLPYLLYRLQQLRHPREAFREIGRAREQSLGYLSFTLHGLAMLHAWDADLPLWQDRRLQGMIRGSITFADECVFPLRRSENRYAFSYNPAGIEMAFVKDRFGYGPRSAEQWLGEQLRRHFNFESGLMTRDTGDERILAARAYELCRLEDREIHLGVTGP